MNIGVLGAGNVGGALATSLFRAGNVVYVGVRDVNSDSANKLRQAAPDLPIVSVERAINQSSVLILALPVGALIPTAELLKGKTDKIILDATNSVFQKPIPYQNGVEVIKQVAGIENVAKCFNTTGFENMANPNYNGTSIDMFIAGSSTKAKEVATALSLAIGFGKVYDFGGDDKVPLIENFAMAWINLAILQKQGRNIAFKVLHR